MNNHLFKRFLSVALALLMVLSCVPTRAFAAETGSGDIVINNPGASKDNELVTNGTGGATDPIEFVVGDNTATFAAGEGRKYYIFKAPANGTVTFTFSADKNWDFLYFENSSTTSTRMYNNPQVDPVTLNEGEYIKFAIIHYEGTTTWSAAEGNVYIKVEWEPAGGTTEPEVTYVAKIGETGYETFAEALTAANAMTGDVEVEIYDKVTLNSNLSGSFDSIKFVGKDTDAEIYLDVQGYITATGKKVAFEGLTLSKSEGGFITNAGFMNVAFGIYDVTEVTYTSCTFANGAYAASGKVTYTDCTFQKSWEKYGLWAYGDVDVTVNGGAFDNDRGIKMYAEGAAKTTDLTVKGVDFSKLTGKPAIVLTYGESVTLEGNTYSDTGVFELDLDGAPNGTSVTSTDAITCVNDNGECGVLVDGKIYTTVAQAVAAAEEGSEVTLLYSTDEAAEFPENTTVTVADGVSAPNVTVATPAPAVPTGMLGTVYVQAANSNGNNTDRNRLYGEITGIANAKESLVIKVYSGETLLATTTLAKLEYLSNATLGANIVISGSNSSSWSTAWEAGMPRADLVPDKAVLYIDGKEMNTANVTLNGIDNLGEPTDWANLPGVNPAPSTTVYVAQIGEQKFETLEEAFANAAAGDTIKLLTDAAPVLTSQRAITKAAVIDLNGFTLTLAEDDLYFGTTTFTNGKIVVDPSVKASTAVFWMFENQTLVFDGVEIVATGVTGTYLIGINGGANSAVKLLNGSKITIANTDKAGLTAVICDNGSGNSVVIEDAVIDVANVDGRFYLGGASGSVTVKNSDIDLNGVKEGFYLRANQTLAIEGNSTVDITLNDTEGRYGINVTDLTASYTVADTAEVNATVYAPAAAAEINGVKYATLQKAIDAVQNGETIVLLGDITEELVTIEKASGLAFTIDGQNFKFTGEFEIGIGESITIQNINFVASDDISPEYFIDSMDKNSNCVLDILNCTFTDTDYSTTAIGTHQPTKVVIDGCTATGVASLLQNQGGYNITVKNTSVEGKRGMSLGTVVGATVEKVTIKAADDKYGIRLNGEIADNTITIKDCDIQAFIPVVVRKAQVENYTVIFEGTNTMTAKNTDGKWMVVGDDEYEKNGELPAAPTGKVTVTLNDSGLDAEGVHGNYVEKPTGTLTNCYTSGTGYWGECGGNAKESFVFKFYNGDTYMGSTSLNNVGGIIDGDVYVSFNIKLDAASNTDEYWTMEWTVQPTLAMQPTRCEQWVDGVKVAEAAVEPNWSDRIFPVVAAVTDENGKILSYVNGTDGHTLADAINAGGNITLLADVTVSETLTVPAGVTVTLDLNGKTVSMQDASGATAALLKNNGTLTIKDTVGGGKLSFASTTPSANNGYASNTISNYGTITIEGGIIENTTVGGACYALDNYAGSTATINGGTLTAEKTAVRIFNWTDGDAAKATLNIAGGEIVSKDGYGVNINAGNAPAVELNISGGKITTNDTDYNLAVYIVNKGSAENLTVQVSGGTFDGDFALNGVTCTTMAADKVSISGGTFEGVICYDEPAYGFISGGTFTSDVSDFVADGYELKANGDGTYGIETATFTKDETNKKATIYNLEGLYAFAAEVNAGNKFQGWTIKLEADIDLAAATTFSGELTSNWEPLANFNGTFDGQGHKISNLIVLKPGVSNVGFFGTTQNGEIKNVVFENAIVTGRLNVGVVAGQPYTSKYTNIKVTGHVEVNGMAYVGGVGGKNAYANWTDVTVDVDSTSYVNAVSTENGIAYRTYVGGVIGFLGEGGHTFKNISSNVKVIGDVCDIGGLFGIAHYGNNFDGVTFTGAVVAPEGAEEVGGIAGVWHNQAGKTVTFENVTSTGTVTVGDETTTGSIVGGAYNAENETPSTSGSLIIEGEEAWLKVAAIGEVKYATLQEAINVGGAIVLLDNVTENIQIPEGKIVNLDLNGKTLNGYFAPFKGNLTVNGGWIVNTDAGYSAIEINAGELVLNNVHISSARHGVRIDGAVTATIGGDGDHIVIKSASGTGTGTYHAVNVSGAANVTIKGCSFIGPKGTVADSGAAVNVQTGATVTIEGGNFSGGKNHTLAADGTLTISGGTFDQDPSAFVATDYAALPDLNGNYVVGKKPTATVNDLGMITVPAGGYMVYGNGDNTADMPLSFVMQFLADQDAEDMANSPFADWYGDFVITFTGIENGSFTADGCYLAGHYGSFGWVKVPVDGMTIEEGARYPVMLGVGMGQKYDYICSSVQDFKCALYLTPEILAANPNIQVKLELAVVDNSKGSDAAAGALINNENVYSVKDYTYDAEDFVVKNYVAQIGDKKFETFEEALAAVEDGQTITLLNVESTAEQSKELDFTKAISFTITGIAPNYALPVITFQNATVTIENAEILTAELDARQNATINVVDSIVHGAGGNSIVKSYYNGAINISGNSVVHTMQLTTMGYITISGGAKVNATWQTNVYGNGMIEIENGAVLATGGLNLTGKDYSGRDNTDADRVGKPATIIVDGATLQAGEVYSESGADYSYNADGYGINVGTIAGKAALLDIKNNATVSLRMGGGNTVNFGADAAVNVADSTLKVIARGEGTVELNNSTTILVSGTSDIAANVTGSGWVYMNGVSLDADTKLYGAKVAFINGTNSIVGSVIEDGWFSVGVGQNDSAAAAAEFAAANGITLGDVTVNVSGDAIIGSGTDAAYSGWIGSAYSADKTQHKYVLNIENSLATFGYLHISKDGELNVKGHATNKYTYDNANVDFYAGNFIVNGEATLDGTDAWVRWISLSADHADGVVNVINGTNLEASRHIGSNTGYALKFFQAGKFNVDATSTVEIDNEIHMIEGAELTIAGAVTVKGAVTGNGTITLTDVNATFEAPEGLTVATNVADYNVAYVDGVYKLVAKVYVAKIGDVGYETLAEALNAAQNGDTITLIWAEGDDPIAMNGAVFGKTVTITGTATVDWNKGYLFVGRGGEGDGTVIFDNANLTSASNSAAYGIHVSGREKDTTNKYNGTLIIRNSTIELDYLINRGTIEVDNSYLTVKNGFGIAGRPASETESNEAATATIDIKNGSYVKVLNHNGMGIGVASTEPEGYGILNLTDSTFECAKFNIDADLGDFNVFGESVLKIADLTGKEIDLQHGAIIKDSTVGGEVMLYGKVIFRGDNTFAMLYDFGNAYSTEYAEWIVEKDASVTLNDTARYGLGYGDKLTVYGSIENALTARDNLTEEDISLFLHGIAMMDGWNVENYLNVEDAYVVIGSNNSFGTKDSYGDKGDFYVVFNNSVVDSSRVTIVAGGGAAYFTITGSDVKTGGWHFAHTGSTATFTDSYMLVTGNGTDYNNINAGQMTLNNTTIVFQSGAFTNNGTLTLGAGSSLTAPSIIGTGKLIIDAAGMTAGPVATISADASGFSGTIEVINNEDLEAKIDENGNIVLFYVSKAHFETGAYASTAPSKPREHLSINVYDIYAAESLVIKVYSNGTLIATSSFRAEDRDVPGVNRYPLSADKLSVNIVVSGKEAGSWDNTWHIAPSVAYIPDTFEVWVDGELKDTWTDGFKSDAEVMDYKAFEGTYKAASVTDAEGNVRDYYLTLAEAFAAIGAGDVVIELLADATLDYNARDAYGTAETTSLTINGNGHTLTLNQKNSDWASIGLANAAAKLVLNNMTIEKTGHGDTSGAWNTHAIIFSCNVEMNDITVNNGIAVQNGATLNNVIINEANGYYGLWINGNGQSVTVNGGEINATNGGRGIKIADQYIDSPAQVTLNVTGTKFNTAKKAAVLVTSTAGAKIAASNVDITNVAADNQNFVWVDEDRAANFGNVEVTGATVSQEAVESFNIVVKDGDKIVSYFKTLDDLFDNVSAYAKVSNVTVELMGDVVATKVVKTNSLKTYNFVTNVADGVTMDLQYAGGWNYFRYVNIGENVTVKAQYLVFSYESTIAGTVDAYYPYINGGKVTVAETGVLKYEGGDGLQVKGNGAVLTVNGTVIAPTINVWVGNAQLIVSGENAKIESNWIDIWDGAPSVTIEDGATIVTKGIKVSRGGEITVTDANLTAETIEVGHNGNSAGTLTESGNSTINGEIKMTATGSVVYSDGGLNVTTDLADHKVIFENGQYKVVPMVYVAQIGEQKFESLAEALAAVQDGDTLTLLADIALNESIKVTNTLTVDLNGKTLTGPDDGRANWYAFIVDGGKLTLTDSVGTGELFAKCYGVETKSGEFILDGAKITATNNATLGSAIVNYGGTVTINSGTISGALSSVFTGGYFSNATTNILGGTFTGPVLVETYENEFTETVTSNADTYPVDEDYKWVEQNGVYVLTAKTYVAVIGEKKFETLAEAIAAAQDGDTVVLLADIDYTTHMGVVSILKNYTIDLNGHTLKANGAAIFADQGAIVDTGATKGLLAVPEGFLLMHNTDVQTMLPVWNEEGTGYVFFNVKPQYTMYKRGDDKFEFNFRPSLGSAAFNAAFFGDGALDNGLKFVVNIHCMKDGAEAEVISFSITDELIKSVYTNGTAIQMNITGAGTNFDSYVMEIVIVSDTGLSWSSGLLEDIIFEPAEAVVAE